MRVYVSRIEETRSREFSYSGADNTSDSKGLIPVKYAVRREESWKN